MANVAMSRVYGWRGGCSAADVPDGGVGSVEWFGGLFGKALMPGIVIHQKDCTT